MAGNVIATLLIKIGVQVNEMNKGFKQVEGKMKGLQGSFKKTAKSIGLIFGGHQVLSGIKNVIKASNDFELELAKLNNVAKLSQKDLLDVGNAAQKLAGKFGVSSNEIVHGLTELTKLGYSTADSLREMPNILKFNIASGNEFGTTIQLLETTMSDFGLGLKDTAHTTDIFTAALGKSANLTGRDLADAFKKAGSSGKNAGASVSDLTTAVSLLANKGFSGAEAGTALNAIFGNLTKTGSSAHKALKNVGISITDSSGKMKPFGQLIGEIQNKFEGLTDSQKNEIAQSIAGKEHMAKFLNIVEGAPGSFEQLSAALNGASGATDKAFKGIDDTANQALKRLDKSFESFQQKIGKALSPAITAVSNAISGILNWFNQLDPAIQTTISVIGALVAGLLILGGIFAAISFAMSALAPIGTLLVGIFGAIQSVVAFLLPILSLLGSLIASLGAPILILVGIIAAAVAAIIIYWEEIVEFFSTLPQFFSEIWNGIVQGVTAFGQFFVDIWNSIIDGVIAAFQWLYDHNYYFQALVDFIVEKFNYLSNFISEVWNAIKMTAIQVWTAIKTAIISIVTPFVQFILQRWENLKNNTTRIFNAIKNVISSIWSSISNTIKGWASKAYQWGANFLQMLINGIKSKVGAIISTVKSIGSSIAKFLGFHSPTDKGPLADSDTWMPNFMKMLEQGLEMGIPRLEMAVGEVAASIATADTIAGASSSVINNINVNARQSNLDERGLGRMLERMRILNGGTI